MGCIISRSGQQSAAAAAVLDDDDLLSEILLRLPPQPSSLPRASLVCKRWRSLISDPGFSRRFRHHHRRNPPLLGCFVNKIGGIAFLPAMEAPNRVPPGRFSLHDNRSELLGCCHGLVLFLDASRNQVRVCDPVTADLHCIAVPMGFDKGLIHSTVLRAGDIQHFQVDNNDKQHRRVLTCVYSSETGVWGDLVSMPIPSDTPTNSPHMTIVWGKRARMVGNSLCWSLPFVGFVEFDLERQNLNIIHVPLDLYAEGRHWYIMLMRAEGGGLGLLFLSDFTAQLWKRTTDGDGVNSWVLGRTIELDKLLPLELKEKRALPWLLGLADENNVVFLRSNIGSLFMIHLESFQFKKLSRHNDNTILFCHPFECVYASGNSMPLHISNGIIYTFTLLV
ncbi:unnamed protein product [Alopecurus aequalis]